MMKYLKWIAAASIALSSSMSFATDIPATEIMDNYVGAGYDKDVYGNVHRYDTDKMIVSRTGTMLNVDVYTSFYNNIGQDGIRLGDLFISDGSLFDPAWQPTGGAPHNADRFSRNNNNTGTDWNYVYDLGGDRGNTSGWGRLKSNFNNNEVMVSNDYHNNSRYNQAVMLKDRSHHVKHNGYTHWSVDDSYSYAKKIGDKNVGYGKVSFSIDVAGTALANATQIAFRWAMTCANDIIEGMVSVSTDPNTTPIPTPQTFLLFVLGIAGIALTRKKA
ncbi:hypothetical protein [Thalassotalea fusca]